MGREVGRMTLKVPVAAVGAGTDGAWTLWARQGAAIRRRGAPDGVWLKASEGSLERASEATQHPFAAHSLGPAPACGDPEE